ncbi:MAG: DUF2459 domain-containing protein [Acidobacteria bacterium]|jgi:uncharacterized protein (TIGR02117 family)|nr:DUF2459 domain-containing protein [Acidobacteriota bacterium]
MFFTGLRWSGLALLASGVCAFWYVGAAWLAGAFHTGGKLGQVPPGKPAAFICEAAFHTDIALPLDGEIINWRKELRGYIPDYLPRDTYLLFGWGDSVFFTKVLYPEDLTIGRGLSALAGMNPVAMRIVPVYGSDVREVCEPLPGGQAAKRVLIDEILGSLKRDSEGAYRQIDTTVPGELLLLAKGRYSPFNTCNQWTASALGKAGLPRALFAPFAWSVTKPLKNTNRKEETDG